MIGMKNKRLKYLLLTLFVVMLGLLSRKMSACTLDFVKLYLGDVLWAMMVYFGCRFLFVNMRKRVACVLALVFSYLIEISQLYHAPWIDAIRSTALGGLVLGFGFFGVIFCVILWEFCWESSWMACWDGAGNKVVDFS